MVTIGYDKPLYILPFDHRASFSRDLFGFHGPLSPQQVADIADIKRVIYDAILAAVAAGVPKDRAGILVDEQFGGSILSDARAAGLITSCPAEKSGQDEFDFEYGDDFGGHIERTNPSLCKVLVRYNPEGDKELNRRQTARLKRLSDYLHAHHRYFMFELLVPPTPEQLTAVGGDKKRFDGESRPYLMVRTIHELQDAGVEADVWKIEGLERREDCQAIVLAARREGRDQVGCIVLGRGENDEKVHDWLATAASVPGFIGFAVGRTTFWHPLVDLRAGKITREVAVERIASSYRGWVDLFEKAKGK